MEMKITLAQDEVRIALVEYIESKLDPGYTIHPSSIIFELEDKYEDRPCGGKTTIFSQISAVAKKINCSGIIS